MSRAPPSRKRRIATAVALVRRLATRAAYPLLTHDTELAASVFADYLGALEAAFEADAFFRACGLSSTFIRHMAAARAEHAKQNGGPS